MKFFKKWLLKQVNAAHDEENKIESSNKAVAVLRTSDEIGLDRHKALRMNIWFASGGKIVETSTYSQNKDQWYTTPHIITEDKDLGEELSKIITMESLRR